MRNVRAHCFLSVVAVCYANSVLAAGQIDFNELLAVIRAATPEQRKVLKEALESEVSQSPTSVKGVAPVADAYPQSSVDQTAQSETSALQALRHQPGQQSTLSGQGIQVQAGSANGSVQAKFLLPVPGNESFALTLSAPTSPSASGDPVKLATLDGLANSFSAKLAYTKLRNWESSATGANRFALFGASAQLGYQQFSFYQDKSLDKSQTSKTPSSASIYYGIGDYIDKSSSDAKGAALAKFSYQNAYAARQVKVVCPTGTSEATVTCINGPVGSPQKSIVRKFSLEFFYTTNAAPQRGFSFAPSLNYDAASKARGIDLPIYFKMSADPTSKLSQLNLGADIGWRNDVHGSFGLFVGTPIDVLK